MTKPVDIPGAADGADALCHPAVSMRALCANRRRSDNERRNVFSGERDGARAFEARG